jgi:2-keto-4-pentenoate hydratase
MTDFVSRLLTARRYSQAILLGPDAPRTLEEGFRAAARYVEAINSPVMGWKVGYSSDGRPIASAMLMDGLRHSGAHWRINPAMPLIPEVEIAVRLARDLPAQPMLSYTREQILEACAEIMIGFELIERRIDHTTPPPIFASLADNQGNAGFVMGDAIAPQRRHILNDLRCQFWIDGQINSDQRGGHPKGDPLIPLVDWANHQCDFLGGLKGGQIITTGSLTPLLMMTSPAQLDGAIESIGQVHLTLTF